MSSLVEKYKLLVVNLYRKTRTRSIAWAYQSNPGKVTATLASGTVEIVLTANDNFEDLYTVRVIGIDGLEIESFNDELLAKETPPVVGFSNYFGLLFDLYQTAKRQATGAEQAFDALLKELEPNPFDDNSDLPF